MFRFKSISWLSLICEVMFTWVICAASSLINSGLSATFLRERGDKLRIKNLGTDMISWSGYALKNKPPFFGRCCHYYAARNTPAQQFPANSTVVLFNGGMMGIMRCLRFIS